jgi:hypothetical protein
MVMDNPLVRKLRIRQIAAGHIKESDTLGVLHEFDTGTRRIGRTYPLKSLKTQYAMEKIEDNLPNKVVVAYQFRNTCAELEKALKRKGIKYMHPSDQVAVKREGRVELVKMQAEKED